MSQKFKSIREHLAGLFFAIFWAVIIAALLVIHRSPYNLFGGSADSACYLLSALAQSQAAIVAIVITLTLVAVQLASQTYSPRVMDLFLKNWQFWTLLFIYGISIMYDVVLLSMIPPVQPDEILEMIFILYPNTSLNISFNHLIFGGLLLMFFCFSTLFLYIPWMTGLLKPKRLIKELENEIKPKNKDKKECVNDFVEKVAKKYEEYGEKYTPRLLWKDEESTEESDKILPLVDVVKKAIRADDSSAAVVGIRGLKEVCCGIIGDNKVERGIVKHFSEHFIEISHVAFSQNGEESVIEVAESLGKIGENAIERRWCNVPKDIRNKCKAEKRGISPEELKGYEMEYFDTATENIAYALKEIGNEAIEKGWTSATQSAANAFATLYATGKEERFPNSDGVILNTCFAPFIVRSMKKDMDFAVERTIKSFKDAFIKIIGMDLHPDEYRWPKEIVEKSVHIIPTERDIWKRGHWREEILNYLIEIGIKAEKAEEATENIRNEMRKQISYVVEGIEKVKYNFPDITTTEGEWLDVISDFRYACHDICSGVYWDYKIKKVDDTFMWILNCMIDIEVKAINKGFGSAIDYFIDVKKFCSRKGKERVIENVFDMYPPVDPIDFEAFEKLEKQKQEKEI